MSKKRYVFDIESDGLLDQATQIWIAVVIDLESGKEYAFSDHIAFDQNAHINDLAAFLPFLEDADEISGHNIINYDLPLLKKLCDWEPSSEIKVIDTLLLSQMLDYKRFGFGHSLEKWAESFGMKKTEIEEWEHWNPKMTERCLVDARVNVKVYNQLKDDVLRMAQVRPEIKKSIAAEHETAKFFAEANWRGWRVNRRKLNRLKIRMETQLAAIKSIVEPQLIGRYKPKFGNNVEKNTRKPKYNANGHYDHHTAKLFDIDSSRGLEDRPIMGEYTPVLAAAPDINSTESLKLFLNSIGWVPLEYNKKKVDRKWINMSPKLCEESLARVGRIGQLIDRYNTTKSRYSILKGWEEHLDENDRLHGSAFTIGTPTFRCRHKGITNVPSADAVWGKGIRAIFICDEGNVIVGGDSSGNQARALCHDINDDAFTELMLNTDVHQRNADILTTERAVVPRNVAKRWYYAWLFGAGGDKLSRYILGYDDFNFGKELSARYLAANPLLKKLITKLENTFDKTIRMSKGHKGYIPAVDGRKVYADSSHKILNYRLQSTEAITCKAALLYAVKKLNEEKIPWWPLIFYHDELQVETPESYGPRVAEILIEAFTEAPKWFNINIMSGDAKIGKSWLQTH